MALQELRDKVENYRENNARQSAMITSLRARVQETEEETGLLATSKSRAEVTIQAVLHENRELKDRLQEMESKLKYVYSTFCVTFHPNGFSLNIIYLKNVLFLFFFTVF